MLKGALVGFGGVAEHGHWPAYGASADLQIVAVVDRSADRRAAAAALDPALRLCPTLEDLRAGPALDFVDICTPPSAHAAPMLQALDYGWHVLCEKPFLLDRSIIAGVRQRGDACGRAIVPVRNWLYAPILRLATDTLRSGAIGRLRRVEIETLRVRACGPASAAVASWRREPAIAGGGILMDHGWHAVTLALHWFDEEPSQVSSSLRRRLPDAVEEEADVHVVFPSGDAAISLTWNAAERRNTMRLVGDEGEIAIDDDVLHLRRRGADDRGGTVRFEKPLSAGSHHADWFAAMLPDVAAAFARPAESRRLLTEAETCLAVIQRAYEFDAVRRQPALH